MGSANSLPIEESQEDLWWVQERHSEYPSPFSNEVTETLCAKSSASEQASSSETIVIDEERKQRNAQKLEEYRKDTAKKHAERREILAAKKQEMMNLREELVQSKKENDELRKRLELLNKGNPQSFDALQISEPIQQMEKCNCSEKIDNLQKENAELKAKIAQYEDNQNKTDELAQKNMELRISIAETQKELQQLNSEVVNFEKERHDYSLHVVALKDVIRVSKQMLQIREAQLQELREKIAEIEANLQQHELVILSNDLKAEYEKQLRNIRYLRSLYEDRQKVLRNERDAIKTQLEDTTRELEKHQTLSGELQERVTELEKANSDKYDEINSLQSNLGLSKAECRGLTAEMNVINQLFSQILVGFNNCQDIDLDKLIKMLEENHDLLTDIVFKEESSENSSALPKVLLDIVNRMNVDGTCEENGDNVCDVPADSALESITEETDAAEASQQTLNSAAEIVQNLPKVWRILTELLSHQNCPSVNIPGEDPDEVNQDNNPCYKSVQTPAGPRLVLSVSKTYIRLKDLIVEKKSLEKETNKLKQLNSHLEGRLQDQEKRLHMVSSELTKTWHVVGKMQRQHEQLHTHEKILCYELSQKRKLLNELKVELEYAREKWNQAREKNTCTEEQWKQLRTEFASRKAINDDLNNSAESGYSDEREGSSDDEPGYETDVSVSETKPERLASRNIDEIVESRENSDNEGPLEVDKLSDAENHGCIHEEVKETEEEEDIAKHDEQKVEESTLHSLEVVQEETKTDVVQSEEEKTNVEKVQCEENTQGNPAVSVSSETSSSKAENEAENPLGMTNESVIEEKVAQEENVDARTEDSAIASDITENVGSSAHEQSETRTRTAEEVLEARNERLRRLEAQCQQLFSKVTNTSHRSIEICSRLDSLHEQYGGESSTASNTEASVAINTEDSQLPQTETSENESN